MRSSITKGELTIIDRLNLKRSELDRELKYIDKALDFFNNHPDFIELFDFLNKLDNLEVRDTVLL